MDASPPPLNRRITYRGKTVRTFDTVLEARKGRVGFDVLAAHQAASDALRLLDDIALDEAWASIRRW